MADELNCDCRVRLLSGFEVAAGLSLPLDRAAITVLFGPSGAGKTTLLRLLAGLDRPDKGVISFRGQKWFDSVAGTCLPPQQRRAGFVAQEYALFPHLTVAANIGYAARPGKAAELLRRFDLAGLAARYPRALSGGERQRVALARALASEPALLLLDEPLSSLDAPTRARTRRQLRDSLLAGGVPCIVVTHDRLEAVTLADWVAVMAGGSLRQCGPVQDVFRHPADREVAESIGVENVLAVHITGGHDGLLILRSGAVELQCVDGGESGDAVACIRAEDIAVGRDSAAQSSVRNRLSGRVTAVAVEGALARVEIDCGLCLVAVITAQSAQELALKPGDPVCASIKTTAVHLARGTP